MLSLDQDSEILPGLLDRYDEVIKHTTKENNVYCGSLAMLTTIYKDRNSSINPEINGKYEEVQECITSASYANIGALLNVGGYDEQMFIDYVDYDMCATLRENGYSIVRINRIGFIHEIGRAKTVNFFGSKTNVQNESAFRKYYQTRNPLYYVNKHKHTINKWIVYRRIIKLFILTVFHETNRKIKLKAMVKGIIDSRRMKQCETTKGDMC